jgi:hypothetical protein
VADAARSLSALQSLLADNTSGDISAQDLRDFLVSAYQPQAVNGFRLTLTTGTPVTTTDVTGATTIYWTPHGHNCVGLYDGTSWKQWASAELSLALGTLVNAMAYDVFVYDNSGTLTLETAAWQNATVTMTIATPCVVTWTAHGLATGNSITFTNSGGALPTGVTANTQYFVNVINANTFNLATSLINLAAATYVATSGSQSGTHAGHSPTARQTALTTQDGVYVKSGATTRRYLGTFVTTATTTTEDSVTKRLLWNLYNQADRPVRVTDTGASWTYTTATFRQANGSSANQITTVVGLAGVSAINLHVAGLISNTTTNTVGSVGIGEDIANATISGSMVGEGSVTGGERDWATAALWRTPSVGYHVYTWLERGNGFGTLTWYGAAAADRSPGIAGNVRA